MKELNRKLGDMEYDGLITGLTPPARVTGGTIAKLTTAATLRRGSLLGKTASTNLLSLYDGTTTPYGILCDDTEVGTENDVAANIYVSGCFDPQKVTVANGYTLTSADKDTLRTFDIVFVAASTME